MLLLCIGVGCGEEFVCKNGVCGVGGVGLGDGSGVGILVQRRRGWWRGETWLQMMLV